MESKKYFDEKMFIDVSSSYTSAVWKHFKRNKLEEKAKCNYCGKILSQQGFSGTTSSLRHHLIAKHEIKVEAKQNGNRKFKSKLLLMKNDSENQAEIKIENPDITDKIDPSNTAQKDALLVEKKHMPIPKNDKKVHSLKFKLKIISEAKKSSNLQVAKLHGIDNSMIGKWRKNESKFKKLFKSSSKKRKSEMDKNLEEVTNQTVDEKSKQTDESNTTNNFEDFVDVSSKYKSELWKFYKKNQKLEKAQCNQCGKIFVSNNNNTGLTNHLKKHDIKFFLHQNNLKHISRTTTKLKSNLENNRNRNENLESRKQIVEKSTG